MAERWLAARSVFWAVLFPGTIAGYIPWRFFGVRDVRLGAAGLEALPGLVLAGAGLLVLVATIWQFAHEGRGTLSPADPPRTLVVRGLYRYVRNPMYLGVTLVLLGEALLAWRADLAVYWAVWFAAVNLFVILYEEPRLGAQFGEAYANYRSRVGRWVPASTTPSERTRRRR